MQQENLFHFVEDVLHYLCVIFHAIYFIILSLSVQNNTFSIKKIYIPTHGG